VHGHQRLSEERVRVSSDARHRAGSQKSFSGLRVKRTSAEHRLLSSCF
jgi:hypothetical protein